MRKEFHLQEEAEGGLMPSDEWEAMEKVAAWNMFSSTSFYGTPSLCNNAVKLGTSIMKM